jgi:hypothetical protein
MKRNLLILLLATIFITAATLIPRTITIENEGQQPEAGQTTNNLTTPKEFLRTEILGQGLADRDFLIMVEIIQCESGWSQFWERDFNGYKKGEVKVANGNIGLAQINRTAHHAEYERLGLDPFDQFDNLIYAVILYKRGGISAWEQWSGHCFLPRIKAL